MPCFYLQYLRCAVPRLHWRLDANGDCESTELIKTSPKLKVHSHTYSSINNSTYVSFTRLLHYKGEAEMGFTGFRIDQNPTDTSQT